MRVVHYQSVGAKPLQEMSIELVAAARCMLVQEVFVVQVFAQFYVALPVVARQEIEEKIREKGM